MGKFFVSEEHYKGIKLMVGVKKIKHTLPFIFYGAALDFPLDDITTLGLLWFLALTESSSCSQMSLEPS